MYRDFREDHATTPHPARYPLFDIAVTENPGAAAPDPRTRANSI